MDDAQYLESIRALPIFPLPRTVLLPGATLPLHVFEQRYRDLVAHCLKGDRLIGIATLRPGYEATYEGSPELFAELGVGELVGHQPYPDGRSNIALRFVGRVRILRELDTEHLFRVVEGEALLDDPHGVEAAIRALRVLVLQLGGLSTDASEEARRLVQLEGMQLADALARRLLHDIDSQLAYLRADRLIDRVGMVQDCLARFMLPQNVVGEA